ELYKNGKKVQKYLFLIAFGSKNRYHVYYLWRGYVISDVQYLEEIVYLINGGLYAISLKVDL
ncbi:MAG: hypothetical protein DWQ04_18235, partial [Chloroflexi bacterium]